MVADMSKKHLSNFTHILLVATLVVSFHHNPAMAMSNGIVGIQCSIFNCHVS